MNERSGCGPAGAQRDRPRATAKPRRATISSHTLTSEASQHQNHCSVTTPVTPSTNAHNVFLCQIDKNIDSKYKENWIAQITSQKENPLNWTFIRFNMGGNSILRRQPKTLPTVCQEGQIENVLCHLALRRLNKCTVLRFDLLMICSRLSVIVVYLYLR